MGNFLLTEETENTKLSEIKYLIRRYFTSPSSKKATTIAGGMSFFIILGIVPFVFIITYILSKFHIDFEKFISVEYSHKFGEIQNFVFDSVKSVSKSVTFIFLATAVYSSSKFFYHTAKSGELIYGINNGKNRIIVRLTSIGMTLIAIFLITACVFASFAVEYVFSMTAIKPLGKILSYILAGLITFTLIAIINIFVCPYKISLREILVGSIVTVIWWTFGTVIFGIYLDNYADFSKLYGTASVIVVFLIYLQLMMQGLVTGIVVNAVYIGTIVKKRKKYNEIMENNLTTVT